MAEMKSVQVMEEGELLEDVRKIPKEKVLKDLFRYELDELSSDYFFLIGLNLKEWERIDSSSLWKQML